MVEKSGKSVKGGAIASTTATKPMVLLPVKRNKTETDGERVDARENRIMPEITHSSYYSFNI